MDDPKKKKARIGYKTVTLAKGGPAEVKQSFHHGAEKRNYEHATAETGHPEYGKAGGGTNPGMNKALADARSGKVEHAEHEGRAYKAGTVSIDKKADQFKTSVKINPTMKMVVPSAAPAKTSSRSTPAKLKKMSITLGGSDRKGNPANKSGVGGKKSIRITKSKSFRPPGQR